MTQDTFDAPNPTYRSQSPPLVNNHFLLPLPGGKYAPRTLTFRRRKHELTHFLEVYDHICSHYKITDEAEKCKGVITYCTSKVARMVEKLPSFNTGDYTGLVKDLYYFLEDDDHTYSISKVQSFTKKWRQRRIESLDQFKRYHRKYLELVGKAAGTRSMTEGDFNRYFWEGIHSSLRRKIENRMLVTDPDLDVSVPFAIGHVVKAAGYILNRRRFDQHLFGGSSYNSSDTDSDSDAYRPKRVASDDTDSDQGEDSDESHESRTPFIRKKKLPSSPKSLFKPVPQPKPAEENEVSKLITRMNKLSIGQLSQADPKQKAYLADMLKNLVEPPREQYHPNPPRNQYNPGPPRREGYPQRDPPPHRPFGEPTRPFQERQEMFCFGCGRTGHRVTQCGELNTLLNQGTIVRNSAGRLQWPDGSTIQKDREDTWVQAINKALKRTNIVKAEVESQDSEGEDEEESLYVGFTREEDDASSDEQEELGWTSGHVSDCYALGAERNPKVSRDTRRQVQFNPPGSTQGMKKFPEHGNTVSPSKQGFPITHGSRPNGSQPRTAKGITPMDVHQRKFEGKSDDQFLPMEVDQVPMVKPGNQALKVTPNQDRSKVPKVTNPRPKTGRTSSEIVQDIMKMPLTVTLEEAVNMSPTLRRDLTSASRVAREVSSPAQEKREKAGEPEKTEKTVLGSNVSHLLPSSIESFQLAEPRDELLKVAAKIGRTWMNGVYDTGSQINVLSDRFMHTCGLPVTTEGVERYRITGVNGGLARCVGIIPKARIYITESEWVTIGDLVIIEHAGFDLLLGRPWITVNRAGTEEKDDGTYLTFRSKGKRYSVNVLPNPDYDEKLDEPLVLTEAPPSTYVVAAVSRSGESEVPDSEPERDLPPADASIGDWEPEKEPLQTSNQGEDEEGEEPVEETQEPDEEDRCWLEPPKPSHCFKESETDPITSFEIETELHESYIKMVKRGAGNAEWDAFRKARKRRLRKDRDLWKKWKEERDGNLVPEAELTPEISPQTPPEPSETLATVAEEEILPPLRNDPQESDDETVITTARRSKRVRKESRKAKESEEWQRMMKRRRAYEHEERLTRKTVKMRGQNKPDKDVSSYGAKVDILDPITNKISNEETADSGNDSSKNEDITTSITSKVPIVTIDECESGGENYDRDKENERIQWPVPENDCEISTYQRGRVLIRERNLCSPPRTQEEAMRPRPYGSGPLGWRITPGNGTYDQNKIYPWVSREELGIILDWVKNLPGTFGKHFQVHSIDDEERIAVTLGRKSPRSRTLTKPAVHRRILELQREEGVLTATPGHSIECVLSPMEELSLCECREQAENVPFTIWAEPTEESASSRVLGARLASTSDQLMEKLTVTPNDVIKEPPKKVFSCQTKEADEDLAGKVQKLAITEPDNEELIDGIGPPEEAPECSTPPTSPDGASDPVVWVDEELAKTPWKQEDRSCQERTYRCGKSRLSQRNLAMPWESDADAARLRDIDELPERSRILDWDRDYKPEKIYPSLSRQETEELINWCDNLPEYEGGGYQFLIHKTKARTITIALIGDDQSPKRSRTIGELVLELGRTKEGKLYEAFEICTVSHGRYRKFIQERDGPKQMSFGGKEPTSPETWSNNERNNIRPLPAMTNPPNDPTSPTTGTLNPETAPIRSYSCFVTMVDHEKQPEEKLITVDKIYEKLEAPATKFYFGPDADSTKHAQLWANPWEARDFQMQKEMDDLFPMPRTVRYAPPMWNRNNGVLAAREILPYVQYNNAYDFAFYAKGVTLVMDDSEGNPTYFRGNAEIRVSQEGLDPGYLAPKRKRVSYLREKMFKMEPREGQGDRQKETDLRDGTANPAAIRDSVPQSYGTDGGPTIIQGIGVTETTPEPNRSDDGAADKAGSGIVSNSGNNDGIWTYQIQPNGDGSYRMVRTTPEGEPLTMPNKEGMTKEKKEENVRDRRLQLSDRETLTGKGNDPHPSDEEIGAGTQICKESVHNSMETLTGHPKFEEPMKKECKDGLESAVPKINKETDGIKATRKTHQDCTPNTSQPSHLLPKQSNNIPFSQTPCRTTMPRRPPPTDSPPINLLPPPATNPPPAPRSSLLAMHAVPPPTHPRNLPLGYNVPLGGGDIIRPTTHEGPGLMAAQRLRKLVRESDPHEHYFEGSGATLVFEDDAGELQTYTGDTEIKFFERNSQTSGSTPRPPPPQRVNEARVQLFRYSSPGSSVDRDPGAPLRSEVGRLEAPLRDIRLDPRVPRFEPRKQPTTGSGEARRLPGSDSVRMDKAPEDRDPIVEALLGLSEARIDDRCTAEAAHTDSISSSEPEESPTRDAQSMPGGVPIGLADRSRPSSPSLRLMDVNTVDVGRSSTASTDNGSKPSIEKGSETHQINAVVGSVAMDIDPEIRAPPNSPPDLLYPSPGDSAPTNLIGTPEFWQEASKRSSQQAANDHGARPSGTVFFMRRRATRAFINYLVWREVLSEVEIKLKEGGSWTDPEIQDRLGAFGLLPWWYDVNLKESVGPASDWETWRTEIVDEWRKDHPERSPRILEKMANDLRKLDEDTRSLRRSKGQATEASPASEPADVEMATTDVPEPPQPIPVWTSSSPPPEAREAVDIATREAKIIEQDWNQLRERVWTLEKQVSETTETINDKLTDLGDRVQEDGIIVADLKWRMAEIQELEDKAKTAGKRTYKKARGKLPTHRYPTRYSGSQADEVLELGRKEFGDVAAKIQAVEERMEEMKGEKERLESELTRIEGLTSKIDAMSSALENFKASQVKINLGTLQHFANLRSFYAEKVCPQLDAHSREIAALNTKFGSLYGMAVEVLRPSLAGRRPPLARSKRTPPPSSRPLANAFNKVAPLPPLLPAPVVM